MLNDLLKKVRFAAKTRLLSIKSIIKGRGFKKFKKQYLFEEVLGSGGFGVVYAGFKLSNYAPVAIKFVERRRVIEWGKIEDERLPMEICMLVKCSRISGVIDLLEWCSVPDGFLIVMDRPPVSMDLYSFITENGQLNEEISRFLFLQIVETVLECIQLSKVLHRDIKNENIVIDLITGRTKLIDFGAATHLKATKYHGFQGTRLYCPPEWFTHSVYLGFEATVWSLGVVLYSMLNGQLPYLNEKDICTKHLLGPLPKFTEYSNEAEDLIQQCLAYEPFRRVKLDKIRRHKWMTVERSLLSWDTMLNEQMRKSPANSVSLEDGLCKESGVDFSIQIPARQDASNDDSPISRQHETVAIFSDRRPSIRHQANTCILQISKQNCSNRTKQLIRSKTAKIILPKLHNPMDSGHQSSSQSPLTSPIFTSSAPNEFVL